MYIELTNEMIILIDEAIIKYGINTIKDKWELARLKCIRLNVENKLAFNEELRQYLTMKERDIKLEHILF